MILYYFNVGLLSKLSQKSVYTTSTLANILKNDFFFRIINADTLSLVPPIITGNGGYNTQQIIF